MGKGNRNRTGRDDENVLVSNKTAKPKKRRARRPLPKLLVPIVALVLVVAIAVTAIVVALANNGTFKRNNVLVKSQKSGKYSLNQQTAQVLIWTMEWDQAAQLYQYYSSVADSEFEYCWSRASTAKYNMNEYIGNYYAKTLVSFVAACDEGVRSGVPFTKADEDAAYEEMLSSLRSEAYNYYSYLSSAGLSNVSAYYVYTPNAPYFGQFLKEALGKDISEGDIRRAAIIQAYANKVYTLKQNEYWETDDATVNNERKNNPESYYSTDYLTYSTEDAALAALLAEKHTPDEFKSAIVTDYVKNHYVALYNRYITKKTADVNSALAAVRDKTTEDDLNAALTEQSMTAAEYAEDDATLLPEQKEWLFAEGRAQFDAASVTSEDGLTVSVIAVKAVDAENKKVTAAIKTFAYEELTADDLAKLTNTVLKALELPVADGAPVYTLASEQADALLEQLNAEGADKAAVMAAATPAPTDAGTFGTDTETVPQAIRDTVFGENTGTDSVYKVSNNEDYLVYVVHVSNFTPAVDADEETGTAAAPAGATASYVTFDAAWDEVTDDLVSALKTALPSKSTAYYQKRASVRAEELLGKLNAAADKADFMTDNGGTSITDLTADNKGEKGAPEEVSNAVLAEGVAAGQVLTAQKTDSTTRYLIYVEAVDGDGVDFYYLTVATYEEGSYQEWLFGNVDYAADPLSGGPTEGDTFKIDATEDDKNYRVYLVVGTPLKLDTETVIRGGYVSFTSAEEAEAAKEKLAGLTGYQLMNALSDLDENATVSNLIRESTLTSDDLKTWFFSADRAENEIGVVSGEGENATHYLAVHVGKLEAWQSSARTNYAGQCVSDWLEGVVDANGYKISEKALKKVKNPKAPAAPEETTEEATAGEVTTAAPAGE